MDEVLIGSKPTKKLQLKFKLKPILQLIKNSKDFYK